MLVSKLYSLTVLWNRDASLACHCEQQLYEVLGGGGEPFPHQLGPSLEGAVKV